MKYLKKINKGLILTVVILLILIIYLISVGIGRNKDKPEIEKVCEEYIEVINEYSITPEKVSKVYEAEGLSEDEKKVRTNEMNSEIDKKMEEFEGKLKNKMIDNSLSIQMQKNRVADFIQSSSNPFYSVLTKYDKEITKITKYSFDEDQVTVIFNAKVDSEIKHLDAMDGNKEVLKKDTNTTNDETITLQKIDGNWKVVYADLQYNVNNINPTGVIYQTMMY